MLNFNFNKKQNCRFWHVFRKISRARVAATCHVRSARHVSRAGMINKNRNSSKTVYRFCRINKNRNKKQIYGFWCILLKLLFWGIGRRTTQDERPPDHWRDLKLRKNKHILRSIREKYHLCGPYRLILHNLI